MHATVTPLEHLTIVQECTALIARFAERTDARDSDALADMFVEDGVFRRPTAPDQPIQGREAIRAGFAARPANKMTRHIVTNTVVTVVDDNEATAVSYLILYMATVAEGGGLPKADAKQLIGAFHDTIVRDAFLTWKFKERRGSLAMSVE